VIVVGTGTTGTGMGKGKLECGYDTRTDMVTAALSKTMADAANRSLLAAVVAAVSAGARRGDLGQLVSKGMALDQRPLEDPHRLPDAKRRRVWGLVGISVLVSLVSGVHALSWVSCCP